MGRSRDTGYLRNLLTYDTNGNITTTGTLSGPAGVAYATQSYVGTQLAALVGSAPTTLDTLNELAAALGSDPNFATTVTTSIGNKLPLSGGTLTGTLNGTNARFFGSQVYFAEVSADSSGGFIQAYNSTTSRYQPYLMYGGSNTTTFSLLTLNNAGATFSGTVVSAGLITGQNGIYQSNAASVIASNRYDTYNGGSTQMQFNFPVAGSVAFNNGSDRFYIMSDGKVGIGTTAPSSMLHVQGSSANLIVADSASYAVNVGGKITFQGNYRSVGDITDAGYIKANKDNSSNGDYGFNMVFATSQNGGLVTERMRIASNGDIYFNSGAALFFGLSTATYLSASTSVMTFAVNNAERMRITNGGNVGIGTSSPFARLHVQDSTNVGTISLGHANYPGLLYSDATSGEFRIDNRSSSGSGYITFFPNGQNTTIGNEAMRITHTRRVGIGTTNPTHALHVESSLRVNRTVYSWYKGSWQGNGTYWHMKTNLYAGAAGNTQYTMSFFKAFMYSYSSASVNEGAYGFHNWSGILYSAASAGNISFSGYISSDGYVVLVILSGSGETGVTIDWHQTYADYPFQSSSVTAAGLHGTNYGKY